MINQNSKFHFMAITFIATLLYLPSFFGWLHADDLGHWVLFKSLNFHDAFLRIWSGTIYDSTLSDWHFRPITNSFFWFLFKLPVPLIKVIVFILHLITGWVLLRLLKGENRFSNSLIYTMVLLFLVSPAAAMSSQWISSLGDVLTTLFSLISLIFLQRYLQGRKKLFILLGLSLFLTSLLSKEMSITIPILLLFYFIAEKKLKQNWNIVLLYGGVALLFIVLRTMIIDTIIMDEEYSQSLFHFGIPTLKALFKYFTTLFIPAPFSLFSTQLAWFISGIPIVLILLLSALKDKNFKNLFLSLCFIIVSIGPVINLYRTWYMYYPLVMTTIILTLIISSIEWKRVRILLFLHLLMLSFFLLNYSNKTLQAGKISHTFFKKIIEINETKIRIINAPLMVQNGQFILSSGNAYTVGVQYVQKSMNTHVTLSGRRVVNFIPQNYVLEKISGQSIQLKTDNGYYHIEDAQGDIPSEYQIVAQGRFGKPIEIICSWDDSIPTYLFTEN